MNEQTGEITTQFAPSLPKKKSLGTKPAEGNVRKLSRIFSREKRFSETGSESVEGGVQELFELLLDKTELEIDIHRQAQQLAKGKATGEEISEEIRSMRDQDHWENKPENEVEAVAKKRVERKKVKELKQDSTDQNLVLSQLTAERQAELVKSGQMRIPDLSRGKTTEEVSKNTLSEG